MKHYCYFIFLLFVLLPGCTPYKPWLQEVFNQGECFNHETKVVRQYIRSEHVYDQFDTLGHFNVLWLSCEVKEAYARVYAYKFCLNEESYEKFLHKEYEENNKTISFYVLTALPSCYKSILSDKDSEWALCLCINGKSYQPLAIKEVNLSPEYMLFFGKTYTRFKTAFLATFCAQDEQGNALIYKGLSQLTLILARADRKVYITWCLDKFGNVIRMNLKKDPDVLFYDLQCCP